MSWPLNSKGLEGVGVIDDPVYCSYPWPFYHLCPKDGANPIERVGAPFTY